MDGFLVLIVLVILAIPVTIVVLLVGQSRLRTRMALAELQISDLTRQLHAMKEAPSAPIAEATARAVFVEVERRDLTDAPDEAPDADEEVTAATPEAPAAPPSPPNGNWTPRPEPEPEPEPSSDVPQGPIVLRPDRIAALTAWLQRNWIYVVSAASLALAGVFLVQYSVQNGLLPPEARVIAAYLFGLGLVGSAEWLRRRAGEGERSQASYIPSVFAGAGLVAVFASTIAGEQLYGMFGPGTAFGLHLATALLALGLGWFYGPLLTAFGLIGASATPFLVDSTTGPTPLLYLFYGILAATGLGVDAIRRWAWISALALVLGYGGGAMMFAGGAGQGGWLAFLLLIPLLILVLPRLSLVPDHPAPSLTLAFVTKGKAGWPEFPVRLAVGGITASTLALLFFPADGALTGMLALASLALMALVLLLWAERAEGLSDLALIPTLAFLLRLLMEAVTGGPLAQSFWAGAIWLRGPEVAPPMTLTWLAALATLMTLAFAYRALRGGHLTLVQGLAAVLVAPLAVATLDLAWAPLDVLGAWTWALHPLAVAGLMVFLAERFARSDGADHRRMAYATLSALSLIALSLFTLTSDTGLTLALAALVVVAAWLDRRFDLREMGVFIQIAVAVLSYRLLLDPGVDWALGGPLVTVLLAFCGPILAYVAALVLLTPRDRVVTLGVLESAALALAAILANVLLTRALVPPEERYFSFEQAHVVTLNAMPWLVLALAQVHRASLGPVLRRTRLAVGGAAGAVAAGLLLIAALPLNPLSYYDPGQRGALVSGPWLLDTVALAYALPALTLLAAAWRLKAARPVRLVSLVAGSALLALYVGLEIRRFWQGDWLGIPGVTEPELYSYTIALMVLGAGLLWQAVLRRSHLMRRIAMAVIALVIAKVFLVDAAGLTGLTRVFSFLGLGLSLAGLAWVNRWVDRQLSRPEAA